MYPRTTFHHWAFPRVTLISLLFLLLSIPSLGWAQDDEGDIGEPPDELEAPEDDFFGDDEDDFFGEDEFSEEQAPAITIHGFAEAAHGARVVDNDLVESEFPMSEARFRLELDRRGELAGFEFATDVVADGVTASTDIHIREANGSLLPWNWLELTAGRDVLTWGTGDLVFLNDMFPKDYVAFFIGRDTEYLKAPSNFVRASIFTDWFGLDLVWTPVFTPDRVLTGERLSIFTPGGELGSAQPLQSTLPSTTLDNSEGAARLHGTVGRFELAAYGYIGFTGQPLAVDPDAGLPTHARLGAYGASLRGPLFGGLFNLEAALHHSLDDDEQAELVPTSQYRGLVGYEHELVRNLTLALQYYAEIDTERGDLEPVLDDEDFVRHLVTSRISYRAMRDILELSLFAFYSPSDQDAYLRPTISYDATDAVDLAVGANIFFGEDEDTFFGQLEDDTNVYGRLRYRF